MSAEGKPRRRTGAGGRRDAGRTSHDPRLSALSHELTGHVLAARLLLESLSLGANDRQRETIRRLGEVVEAEAVVARRLSELARPDPDVAEDGDG